ncbi:Mannose-6-phosphate isomerase ManA [Paenibacillus solanacearum]|uniref:Mannose-6-phosphate isomerase n=1 Tax=Paenibacillus solanacearum TaxID=2048548 RepID=A0A916NQE0_9BACL|nr:type I phosphomannose isomerase catalytic subunit [Paenibacillus solanacearum]CAG7623286.1 Mannose-6-phosphate isomerase ManA [Paenibacillus solanacearum]
MRPYPLQCAAQWKERVWGGQSLAQFGLDMPKGTIGEAWMIGDHPNGTTSVLYGELAGWRLDRIRESYGEAVFGRKGISEKTGRFPLLIKLLDCQEDLSVQVHPDDLYDRLPPGELGKTEMWYVLAASPGAKIIYGLKDGVTRERLAAAIETDRIMDCLNEVPVEAGDAFYIPAGTVHALGSGMVVAEIQQNSDSTYRLYDYGRPGLDGKRRELHIDDSLRVIAYEGNDAACMKTALRRANEWLTLVRSPYFVTEKGQVEGEWTLSTSPDSFVIHIICEGAGSIRYADGEIQVQPGECFLLPASLGAYRLTGRMTVLRSYLP